MKPKPSKCRHYWCYEHTIWQASENDESSVAVGRYCSKCGKMQTAVCRDWHPIPSAYVDMRDTLRKSYANK